jgi:hypothetical protein
MKYSQSKGKLLKSTIEIDLQETGFKYLFTDKGFFGQPRVDDAFIPYANITNQKIYTKRSQPAAKKIVTSLAVLFVICFIVIVAMSTNIAYGSSYETWLSTSFYALLVAIYLVYKFLGFQKVILIKENNGHLFTLLQDKQSDLIIKEILDRRNAYLKNKFIENNNYKMLSAETVEYLGSLGVITQEEAISIKEKNKPNGTGVVGFGIEEEK